MKFPMMEPGRTDESAFETTLHWAQSVDDVERYRDISDAARRWAEEDRRCCGMPSGEGELSAMLEMAFDAGRFYQMRAKVQP